MKKLVLIIRNKMKRSIHLLFTALLLVTFSQYSFTQIQIMEGSL
jgi:hypothetical protein